MELYGLNSLYAQGDVSGTSQSFQALGANHGFSEGSSSGALSYQPTMPSGGTSGQRMPQNLHSYPSHPHATFYTEDFQPSYFHRDLRTAPVPSIQPPPLPFDSTNIYKPPDHPPPPLQKLPTPSEMAIILAPSGHGPLPLPPETQMYASPEEELTVSREKKHGCSMCHKRFDRPSTLRKHLLVHTGEKAFQCETCGRRFGVASNLNRHVRKCILKPVNVHAAQSSSSALNTTSTPLASTSDADASSSTSTRVPAEAPAATRTETSQLVPITPEQQRISPLAEENTSLALVVSSRPKQTRKNPSPNASESTPIPSPSTSSALIYVSPGGGPPPSPNQPKRRRRAPSPSRWVPPSLARFQLFPPQKYKTVNIPLPPVTPTELRRSPALTAGGLYVFSDPDLDRYPVPSGVLTSRTQNSAYGSNAVQGTSLTSFSYPAYSSHINITLPVARYPTSHSDPSPTSNSAQPDDTVSSLTLDLASLFLYEERDSFDDTVGTAPYHPREWEHRPILPGPGVLSLLSHHAVHSGSSMMSGGDGNGDGDGNGSGNGVSMGMGVFSVFGYRSSNAGGDSGRGRSRGTKGSGSGNGNGAGSGRRASGGASASAGGGYRQAVSQTQSSDETSNAVVNPNFVANTVDIVAPQPALSALYAPGTGVVLAGLSDQGQSWGSFQDNYPGERGHHGGVGGITSGRILVF